jgi:hypothetical protein
MAQRTRRQKGTGRQKGTSAWDRINPYVNWALGPGRSEYFIPGRQEPGRELMPLLLQLKSDSAKDFLDGVFIKSEARRKHWQDSFRILCSNTGPADGKPAVWASTMATPWVVETIASVRARRALDGVSLGRPLDTQALPESAGRPKAARRRAARRGATVALGEPAHPPAVVMGVIDDGIAFAHERFRKIVGGVTETRVDNWWLQDGPNPPPAVPPFTLPPPQNVPYGCELYKSQIDWLLQNSMTGGVIDEDLVYRKACLIDFAKPLAAADVNHQSAAWRGPHGTHVMDLACGCDPSPPVHNRPIVCVQLPTRVTADERPGELYSYIADGITHIVDRAQALAPTWGVASLPVVINVSYGLLADPHDGTGPLEAFIDDKVEECRNNGFDLRVVLPSGNSYLSRIHGQVSFSSPAPRTLRWRVQPDDQTPSFLEIWLPRDPVAIASRVTLSITSPTGANWIIPELPFSTVYFGPPMPLNYGQVSSSPWMPSNRTRFIIMLRPTVRHDLNPAIPRVAPAGVWEIELRNTGGLTAAVRHLIHAWVRRDDHVYGFPLRGRQSYLDDPRYRRFDHAGRDEELDNAASLVKRESTINSLATGTEAIVIGGYLKKERVVAKYSAAGARTGMPAVAPPPFPDPPFVTTPRWPDAVAVSDDSRVHTGVLAAGSHSNSRIAMDGTSVAAPQIARLVADDLAMGGPGNRATVQSWAVPLPPQFERSGAGRIATVPIVRLRRYE